LAVITGIPGNGSKKNVINGLHQTSELSAMWPRGVVASFSLQEIVSNNLRKLAVGTGQTSLV
jgi:hypothetical protein